MNAIVTIYGLFDPISGHLRYVGKSFNVKKRFWSHLKERTNTHKCNWIQSLATKGLKPVLGVIEVLENVADEDWQESERFWIESLRQIGCKLTNLESGGVGGKKMSDESRLKMSKASKGRKVSGETKLKISKAHKGRVKSEEECKNISAGVSKSMDAERRAFISTIHKGRKRGAETLKRLSDAAKAKPREMYEAIAEKNRHPSAETLAKMSAASKGRWLGKHHSVEARAKMSIAAKGKSKTKAHIEKMMASRWTPEKRAIQSERAKKLIEQRMLIGESVLQFIQC